MSIIYKSKTGRTAIGGRVDADKKAEEERVVGGRGGGVGLEATER